MHSNVLKLQGALSPLQSLAPALASLKAWERLPMALPLGLHSPASAIAVQQQSFEAAIPCWVCRWELPDISAGAAGWGQGRGGGAQTESRAPRQVCPAKNANPCPDTTPPRLLGTPPSSARWEIPAHVNGFWGVCLRYAEGQFWQYSIGSSRKRIWARAQTARRESEPGTMGAGSPPGLHPHQPSPDP